MKLRAGEMRERVEIWGQTLANDGDVGGLSAAPEFIGGPYPAKIAPQDGFQRIEASAARSISRKIFWMRYTTAIAPSMWLKHNGLMHTIVLVEQVEHREVIAVHCEARDDQPT